METVPHPAQEGTSLSDRDTGVPLEVHNAPQCTAVNDILARVGDKWSVRVVMGLADGSRRFNELRRDIPGISQRMLTRTLRGLERDGLVSRSVVATVPVSVTYAVTPLGRTLMAAMQSMIDWAETRMPEVAAAQMAYDQRSSDAH